jgi:outer membrane lipoprotein-sorting protein
MLLRKALLCSILPLAATLSLNCFALVSPDQFAKYITPADLAKLNENQKRGLEIAIEQDMIGQGWVDSQANMNMVLRNQHGDESKRELRLKALEVIGDGDKSLAIFDQPKDVQGTAFLTFSHTAEADEQWIYLPALKRVKRINSSNKSGPFMGSEFAYEDIASFEVNKYDFNYVKDENYNGVDCYVTESFPRDKNSGYTKIITWIDKEHFRIQKADFYDRKNSLLKSLQASDYKHYLDKFWRPGISEMKNHQTGKSTVMSFKDYKFNNGFSTDDFNKNSLQRAK